MTVLIRLSYLIIFSFLVSCVGTDFSSEFGAGSGLNFALTSPVSSSGGIYSVIGSCDPDEGDVILTGDIAGAPITTPCNAPGEFNQPVTLTNPGAANTINATQGSNTDSVVVMDSGAPPTGLTVTSPSSGDTVGSTFTITGTCNASNGNVSVGGPITGSPVSAACSGGTYSLGPLTATGPDGPILLNVSQDDGVGGTVNVGLPLDLDTTGPNVTIASPTSGSYHNNLVAVNGACESSEGNVELHSTDFPSSPVILACVGNAYTGNIGFTGADGPKSFDARQTDGGGNQTIAGPVTFNLDNTAPNLTVTSPASGSTVPQTFTITGACESASGTVSFSGDITAPVGPVACTGDVYSTPMTLTAGDGVKNINLQQVDPAGNTATVAVAINMNSNTPAVSISNPTGGSSVNGSFVLNGVCASGASGSVTVTGDLSGVPFTLPCSSNAFNATVNPTSGDGAKNITVTQNGPGGSSATDTVPITLDTVAPALTVSAPTNGSTVSSPVPITGTCDSTAGNVSIAGDVTGSPITCSCVSNVITSCSAPLTAPDGAKNITVSQTDPAGNTTDVPLGLTLDTMAPSPLTVTSHTSGETVMATENYSGACDSSVSVVTITSADISGSPVSAICNGSGLWNSNLTFTGADGTKNFTLNQTDLAGNSTNTPHSVVLDTVGPALTVTAPTAGANVTSPTAVTGTCESAAGSVTLTGADLMGAPITCACTSNVITSCNAPLNAPDGPKTFTVSQTDPAGNPTDIPVSVNLVTSAPGGVAVTSHTLGETVVNPEVLSGACDSATSTVDLVGADLLGSPLQTSCTAGGTWSLPVNFNAPDGVKNFTVGQTNGGGTTSILFNLTLDTTGPALTVTAPTNGSFVMSPAALTGTCESSAGSVTITGSDVTGSPLTCACTSNAIASCNVPLVAPDGVKTFTVSQTDPAGNQTDVSVSVNLDTTPPSPLTLTSHTAGDAVMQGESYSGACDNTVATVTITSTDVVGSPITASCNSGAWTSPLIFNAPDGAKNFNLTQTDTAGNTATVPFNVVLDTVAPALTVTAPSNGDTVNSPAPLTGTCESAAGSVSIAGDVTGSPITCACTSNVITSCNLPFTSPDGAKDITVSQTDDAGNQTDVPVSVILDTAAPSPLTVTSHTSGENVQNGETYSGVCDSSVATVSISGSDVSGTPITAACTSGTWSSPLSFVAPDGTKNFTLNQTDLAGNATNTPHSVVLDTAAPALTVTSPSNGDTVQSPTAMTGTCDSAANTVVDITGDVTGSPITCACTANVITSCNLPLTAPDGLKNLVVSQTDPAGNTASVPLTLTSDNAGPAPLTITSHSNGDFVGEYETLTGACVSAESSTVVITGDLTGVPITAGCISDAYTLLVQFTSPDGAKTVTTTQTDAAGNSSNVAVNVTLDTTAPVLTVTAPVNGSSVQSPVALTGTCETSASTTVDLAGDITGSPITCACTADVITACSVPLVAPDGVKNFTVSQTDPAGNTGSVPVNVILDTAAPSPLDITSHTNGDVVGEYETLAGDCVTAESGVVVLTGDLVGAPLTITCSGDAFTSLVQFTSPGGAKSVTVTQTDAAGNSATDVLNVTMSLAGAFTFNCSTNPTLTPAVQTASVTSTATTSIPITGVTAGPVTVSITASNGYIGTESLTLSGGETSIAMSTINFDGTAAAGDYTLAVTSAHGTGTCNLDAEVGEYSIFFGMAVSANAVQAAGGYKLNGSMNYMTAINDVSGGYRMINTEIVNRAVASSGGAVVSPALPITGATFSGATGAGSMPASCDAEVISVTSCGGATSITVGSNTYSLVEIGGMCWFADSSIEIPSNFSTSPAWVNNSNNGWHGFYNGAGSEPAAGEGRLYTWAGAMNNVSCTGVSSTCGPVDRNQGVCPAGYHVPSDCELYALGAAAGGAGGTADPAGTNIKTGGSTGFNKLFSGYQSLSGSSSSRGSNGYLWSSSEANATNTWLRFVTSATTFNRGSSNKAYGYSVRCLKD